MPLKFYQLEFIYCFSKKKKNYRSLVAVLRKYSPLSPAFPVKPHFTVNHISQCKTECLGNIIQFKIHYETFQPHLWCLQLKLLIFTALYYFKFVYFIYHHILIEFTLYSRQWQFCTHNMVYRLGCNILSNGHQIFCFTIASTP